MLVADITYDVPSDGTDRKLYADRHRRREESAIFALSDSATADQREKKARERQELRKKKAEVRSVLDYRVTQRRARLDPHSAHVCVAVCRGRVDVGSPNKQLIIVHDA